MVVILVHPCLTANTWRLSNQLRITVRVFNYAAVPEAILLQAEPEATGRFE